MNPGGLRFRISAMLAIAGNFACSTQTADDPLAREQALASTDVWHAAKLRGVAFRAIGQEPGWLLEITDGKEILLAMNYGQQRKSFRYVEPREDKAAATTLFQIQADTSVLIEGKPCNDVMSGEPFPTTVTVTLEGKTYRGCGRALF
jgi:putative lipoprotein